MFFRKIWEVFKTFQIYKFISDILKFSASFMHLNHKNGLLKKSHFRDKK